MEVIRIAESAQDLDAAYRFWYRIYVVEMGRHGEDPLVSHDREALYDRLAARGTLFMAENDGEVVGTVLTTPAGEPFAASYRTLYALDDCAPEHLLSSCITTKLMLAKPWRNTRLLQRLVCAGYEETLRQGMRFNYIDCNDHLLRLFQRFGYTTHLPTLQHPAYGQVNSLRLALTDAENLARSRSPFLRHLLAHKRSPWLPARCSRHTARLHHEVVTAEEAAHEL